jgi:hypothetical protein
MTSLSLHLLWAVLSAAPVQRIVVLDVKPRVGVSNELAQAVTDDVVVEIRKRAKGISVVGAEEIRSMLGHEQERQKMGCQEVSCLAEIGGAMGAATLVIGTLARFGTTYLLTLQVVNVRAARVEREASLKISGKNDESLLGGVAKAVAQIFPNGPPGKEEAGAVPEAAVAEAEAEPSGSHVLRWTFLGGAVAAAAVGVVGLVEVLNYTSLDGQLKNQQIPAGMTYAKAQSQQGAAGTWGTAGLVLGGVAAACVVGMALTW